MKPTKITVTTLPSHTVTSWTYASVLSAIDAHETGDFSRSAALADAFGRDDRINACITTRIQAVTGKHGADFSIQPSTKGNKSRAKRLAKDVETWWYDALPERTLKRIFRDVLYMGISISRLEWNRRGAQWIPKAIPWPMRDVYWDETRRCFIVSAIEGQFEVRRGDPNWLIVASSNDEPWMDGLVRALGLPYFLRTLSARDWARFCERHGLPIIAIKEPTDADEDAKKAFASGIRNMGREGVIRLPQSTDSMGERGNGFDVSFIEARDTAWQTFEAFRKDLSTSIAVGVLGQNLTTEVQGGSLAAASMHDSVRREYRDSDVELLSTEIHDGVFVPYVGFHYPNDIDATPWPHWDTAEPADQTKIVQTANQAAAAIVAFKQAGLRVDLPAFLESVGIPMLAGDPLEEVEETETEGDPVEPPEDDDEETEATSVRLASGDVPSDAKGFVDGQRFVDDLAHNTALAASKALAPSLDKLIEIIDAADSFEDVRAALGDTYASMTSDDLEELIERAEIMARLAGRVAVLQDV
jgi:phage gp29-like protein